MNTKVKTTDDVVHYPQRNNKTNIKVKTIDGVVHYPRYDYCYGSMDTLCDKTFNKEEWGYTNDELTCKDCRKATIKRLDDGQRTTVKSKSTALREFIKNKMALVYTSILVTGVGILLAVAFWMILQYK